MKKITSLLLSLALLVSITACGATSEPTETAEPTAEIVEETADIVVGLVCLSDENDMGYTYNIMRGTTVADEKLLKSDVTVEWVTKYNIGYDSGCETAVLELAEYGCDIIICTSYGHEPYMLKVAPDYPEIEFVALTNEASAFDDLANTHNAFVDIYEGQFIAGMVGGMKIQEMISNGEISEDEAVIGAVAPFAISEVISGYTAFFLGARMACPSVTMDVIYTSSWMDATAEAEAAQALIDGGAVLISQHTDTSMPATVAQENGVWHCGYNTDMAEVAPEVSLISTYINWASYYEYAITSLLAGEEIAQDWTSGVNDGAVIITPLNQEIAAYRTAQSIDNAVECFAYDSIGVFDGPWTGTGTAYGAEEPDTKTVESGETFLESDVENGKPSAPYFYWILEDITELN